jgi:hypothetical protein
MTVAIIECNWSVAINIFDTNFEKREDLFLSEKQNHIQLISKKVETVEKIR